MKKFLISILLALSFIVTPLCAFEWGGVFRDETGASFQDVSKLSDINAYTFNQGNSLYFWANKGLTEDSSWYLSSEALYKFKFTSAAGVNSFLHIVDLDLLKVTGRVVSPKSVFNLAMGRYFVLDNTASIFAQTCDGISAKVSFPVVDLSFYAGYTGLLNSLAVTMIDQTGVATAAFGQSNMIYSLSHSYAPLIVSAEFPTFAGVQTLGIQASAFLDLDPSTLYNRYYANLMMKGPIAGSLFYSVNTTFGFPNFKELSNLSEVVLSGYVNDIVALYASVKYASGNHACFTKFRGVTSNPAYNSLSQPELSGVLIPGLKALFAFGFFDVSIDSKYVVLCPENDFTFSGVDVALGSNLNIFSDLQLGLTIQTFFDLIGQESTLADGRVYKTYPESYYKISLNLSFSF